jgi:hypothetical protein
MMSTKPFVFQVQPLPVQPGPVTPPPVTPPTCAVQVNDTCSDAAKHSYAYQNGVLTISDGVVPPPIVIGIGSKVETIGSANVRKTPGGASVGSQPAKAQGVVSAGPQTANGFPWWSVNFANAPSGWVGADNLELSSGPSLPQS